jgi:hypothetical protein
MGMFTDAGKSKAKEMESQRLGYMLDSLGFQEKKSKNRGKRDSKDKIVVMDETVDPTRKPTDEELEEYMRWLGMDLKKHAHLKWIAHLGLTSKIEDEWKPCKIVESGQIFYFNFSTGESIWDHPVDVRCKAMFERTLETHINGFRFPDPGQPMEKSEPLRSAGKWQINLTPTPSGCTL